MKQEHSRNSQTAYNRSFFERSKEETQKSKRGFVQTRKSWIRGENSSPLECTGHKVLDQFGESILIDE